LGAAHLGRFGDATAASLRLEALEASTCKDGEALFARNIQVLQVLRLDLSEQGDPVRLSNAQALLSNDRADVGEHVLMKRSLLLAQGASLGSPSPHLLLHLLGVQAVLPSSIAGGASGDGKSWSIAARVLRYVSVEE
jgi:hypothetical protein